MAIGLITGSGTYSAPGAAADPQTLQTRFGAAEVTRTELAGVEVLHVSRHGTGHRRLSNHVDHRANIAALADLGAQAVLAVTVCGAVDRASRIHRAASATTACLAWRPAVVGDWWVMGGSPSGPGPYVRGMWPRAM